MSIEVLVAFGAAFNVPSELTVIVCAAPGANGSVNLEFNTVPLVRSAFIFFPSTKWNDRTPMISAGLISLIAFAAVGKPGVALRLANAALLGANSVYCVVVLFMYAT